MTAQCMGIPEAVQRPLAASRLSVAQLNIADGSTGVRGDMVRAMRVSVRLPVCFVFFFFPRSTCLPLAAFRL